MVQHWGGGCSLAGCGRVVCLKNISLRFVVVRQFDLWSVGASDRFIWYVVTSSRVL